MTGTNFTEIAARYERDSLIQKSAAEKLLALLDIKRTDRVLDLGCGTGNLTRKLRALTDAAVTGIDPSEGMIRQAAAESAELDIGYRMGTAEDLGETSHFDVIFCNSTFQWFRNPDRALANCFRALAQGGRMGIQAPATSTYCPNFLRATAAVAQDGRTSRIFSTFRPPWLFRETGREYGSLFERAGFTVPFAVIEEVKTSHAPDQVMTIFESGAAAGYLNQEFYKERVDQAYTTAFRTIVLRSFDRQAGESGKVELIFSRIYLLAVK